MRDVHWVDAALRTVPGAKRWYWRRSARIKKAWCLALDRAGRLRPTSFVYWVATYRCNLGCGFCEASAGEAAPGELTTDEVRRLLRDLHAMGVTRWLISGGEPAMRKDLPALLDYGEQLGIAPGLITNGTLIDLRWRELSRFRYFAGMTSVDGPAEMHDCLRGRVGTHAAALRALELFASAGVPMRAVKTVVFRENLGLLEEMLGEVERSGATHWQLAPVLPSGRAAGSSAFELDGAGLRELVSFVSAHARVGGVKVRLAESCGYLGAIAGCEFDRPFFCGAGLTRCAVMPNGDVQACAQVYGHARPEGNIRETPLPEIWRERFRGFRSGARPAKCGGCGHWDVCQGGCWSERQIRGACRVETWECGNVVDALRGT